MDDDDGILANGTPHLAPINLGFSDKGFPAYSNPPTPNACAKCLTIDFRTEDDFVTVLRNGQGVSSLFGRYVTISATGPNAGPAVFESTPGGPNQDTEDLDLLVGKGNVLILQGDPSISRGRYDNPGASALGGTLRVDLTTPSSVFSIDLVDISAGPPAHSATVTLTDDVGKRRTFVVPGGWTGNTATSGRPRFRTLQLNTLANQPGFAATATATEESGFRSGRVATVEVQLTSRGGVDNLNFCTPP